MVIAQNLLARWCCHHMHSVKRTFVLNKLIFSNVRLKKSFLHTFITYFTRNIQYQDIITKQGYHGICRSITKSIKFDRTCKNTGLTSLSSRLCMPICARWSDSANLSSASLISSSVTVEPAGRDESQRATVN